MTDIDKDLLGLIERAGIVVCESCYEARGTPHREGCAFALRDDIVGGITYPKHETVEVRRQDDGTWLTIKP